MIGGVAIVELELTDLKALDETLGGIYFYMIWGLQLSWHWFWAVERGFKEVEASWFSWIQYRFGAIRILIATHETSGRFQKWGQFWVGGGWGPNVLDQRWYSKETQLILLLLPFFVAVAGNCVWHPIVFLVPSVSPCLSGLLFCWWFYCFSGLVEWTCQRMRGVCSVWISLFSFGGTALNSLECRVASRALGV